MPRLLGELITRAVDANGDPVSGALLYVFAEGTTTPVTTYSDEALTTPHAHPVVASSAGVFAPVFVPSGKYKASVRTAADVELPGSPVDDITSGISIELATATITPTGWDSDELIDILGQLLSDHGVAGGEGGGADDTAEVLAQWNTGTIHFDQPYRVKGQLTVEDNHDATWAAGAKLYPTGYSTTGSFITNSVGSSAAGSIMTGARFLFPQVDFSEYPAPVVTQAGAGSSTTEIVLASSASALDDAYNGLALEVVTGNGAGHGIRFIIDYVGATRTATINEAISGAPDENDIVHIGWNDNAMGFASGASVIKSIGAHVVGGSDPVPAMTGEKGVNYEQGCNDVFDIGGSYYDCRVAGVFIQGIDGTAGNGAAQKATNIRVSNFHAKNCGSALLIAGINPAQEPDGDGADNNIVVDNFTWEDCGHAPFRVVSSDPEKGGVIVLAEAQNVSIRGGSGFNATTYPGTSPGYPTGTANEKRAGFGLGGNVGSLIFGHGRNILITDIRHVGALDSVVRMQRARPYGDDAPATGIVGNCFNWTLRNIQVLGAVTEILSLDDDVSLHPAATEWTGEIEAIVTSATRLVDVNLASFSGVTLTAIELATRKRVIGTPQDILIRGNTFDTYPIGTTDLRTLDRHNVVIADDAVYSFTPLTSFGILRVMCASTQSSGQVHFSTTTPECYSIGAGSNFVATTGVLAGTTGTDNRLTVSAHTDGKIYVENRRGGLVTVRLDYTR